MKMSKYNYQSIVYYKRRWYILTVVSLVNFSSNMTWLSYTPISAQSSDYYGTTMAPIALNIVFMIFSPVGILSMWANAKYGLRLGCLVGAWFNFFGSLLRLFASSDMISSFFNELNADEVAAWRFRVTLLGQIIAACAQPFVTYLPAMLAAVWFPTTQRVLANTLASLSNPLGAAAMFALAPQIVNDEQPYGFFKLNGIVAVFSFFGAFMSLGVTSSCPPSFDPIKEKSSKKAEMAAIIELDNTIRRRAQVRSFWHGIRLALASRSFIVLALSMGSGFGLFNALCNFLQPVLCARGYSNTLAGALGGGMIVVGLITSAFIGVFVGRTRLYEETMKACYCGAALSSCAFMVLTRFNDVGVLIALAILTFGAFGLTIYPLGLEMGVETTFPVPESLSTGLLMLTGQVFGIAYISLTSLLRQPAEPNDLAVQTCTNNESFDSVFNWKYSLMIWTAIAVGSAVAFAFTFWPRYHRLEYELAQRQQNAAQPPMRLPLSQLPTIDEPLNLSGNHA